MRLASKQRPTDFQSVAIRRAVKTIHVGVVDPNQADYGTWLAAKSAGHNVELHFIKSGRDALRLAGQHRIDLWVVNAVLPDRDGIELCAMLRGGASPSPVYLVSDAYSADLERGAYVARVSLYGAKPAHRDWLDQWLAHRNLLSPVRCS